MLTIDLLFWILCIPCLDFISVMTQRIQVFDDKKRRPAHFTIRPDNCISRRYLCTYFGGLTGLTYDDTNGNIIVYVKTFKNFFYQLLFFLRSVSINENDDFVDEWHPEYIYKPVFSSEKKKIKEWLFPFYFSLDSRRSSQSSISWTTKICNWLMASGGMYIFFANSEKTRFIFCYLNLLHQS